MTGRKKLKLNTNDVVILEPDKLAKLLEKFVVKEEGSHWWFRSWYEMSRQPKRTSYVTFNATHYAGGGSSPVAHRWVWMQLVGPIENGLVLDHLCVFKGCVNPEHIEMVTGDENSRRSHHTKCVQRGEGTRYRLAGGDDICIHDDRSVVDYELIERPSAESVAAAKARPPRPKKRQPRTTEHVSRKLWDAEHRVHVEPAVYDDLPERVPSQCQWESIEMLSNPIREMKVICHERVVGGGGACASHGRSAFFRK